MINFTQKILSKKNFLVGKKRKKKLSPSLIRGIFRFLSLNKFQLLVERKKNYEKLLFRSPPDLTKFPDFNKSNRMLSYGLHVLVRTPEYNLLSRSYESYWTKKRSRRQRKGKKGERTSVANVAAIQTASDPFLRHHPSSCRRYVRSFVSRCPFRDGCVLGPRACARDT